MYVVVVTGGLGAGKSSAAAMMTERGAVVIDLDDISRHLLEPGQPLAERVAEVFPETVRADGSIDRAALASVAFATPEAAERLNAISHPAIESELGSVLSELAFLPDPPGVLVIEVPLLVEVPTVAEMADVVLAIAAPENVRFERAVQSGLDPTDVRARIALQASDPERAALADHVIDNVGSIEELRRDVYRFWDEAVTPHAP